MTNEDYEDLLKELTDKLFNEEFLAEQNQIKKIETIYECIGKYKFVEVEEDEEEYY